MPLRCIDDSSWNNLHGKTCADYGGYCEAGAFRLGASWAGGEVFNWPERHCCACGKPAEEAAPEKPVPLFEMHKKSFCRGTDHEVKLRDAATCQEHCQPEKRPCQCFHYAVNDGTCHFTFKYAGLQTSTKSSTAWVRTTALLAPQAGPSGGGGASCAPLPPPRVPPSFYLYNDAPFAWGPRLAACYASRTGKAPWAFAVNDTARQLDGAPQPGLAYRSWCPKMPCPPRVRTALPSPLWTSRKLGPHLRRPECRPSGSNARGGHWVSAQAAPEPPSWRRFHR